MIGIDAYRSWPPLGNAVGDASAARLLFTRLGFEELTAPLFDERATGAALQALVTDDLMSLGTADSLVLFYAGHGTTRTQQLAGKEIKTGYLIPSDAANERNRIATCIDLHAWLDNVSRLPPRHILVILDACHSGIALGPVVKWRDVVSWSDVPSDTLAARISRRIITSALDDELAVDGGPVPGHSLFTGCLIEALTGGIARTESRTTTGSELGIYLQHRVRTYPSTRQTPDFGTFDLDERGEMLIPLLDGPAAAELRAELTSCTDRAPRRAPGAQPVPAPPPASPQPTSGRSSGIPAPRTGRPLNGAEIAEIREVLLDAFDRSGFDRLLSDRLGYDREREVGDGPLGDIIDSVVRDLVRQGRGTALIAEAAIARPHNTAIQDIRAKYMTS